MFRRLFTVLALLTGLAALAEPAQAARADTALEAVGAAEQAVAAADAIIARADDGGAYRLLGVAQLTHAQPSSPDAIAPAVQLKADRARE